MGNKLVALNYTEKVDFIFTGCGTSQGSPQLTELMESSRATIEASNADNFFNKHIRDHFNAEEETQAKLIYRYLIVKGLLDPNFLSPEEIIQDEEAIRKDLLEQKFDNDVISKVFVSLKSIYDQLRPPRQIINYRHNASGLITMERTERLSDQEGVSRSKSIKRDAILIDMPPGLNIAMNRIIRGAVPLFHDARVPETALRQMVKIFKHHIEELKQLCIPTLVPFISTVMYTHDHYDHVAGADYFRELYKANNMEPIEVVGQPRVFKKLRDISPQYFKPSVFRFERDNPQDWQQQLDEIKRYIKDLPKAYSFTYNKLGAQLRAKGYWTGLKLSDMVPATVQQFLDNPSHLSKVFQEMNLPLQPVDVIEYALPFGKEILPHPIIAAETTPDGLLYSPINIGKFDVEVIPLDINHGPDWEKINRQVENMRYSETLRQIFPDNREINGEDQHGIQPNNHINGYFLPAYRFAYITDAKDIPAATMNILKNNVDKLVINGLRFKDPHASHLTIEEAIHIAFNLNVVNAYITHMAEKVYVFSGNQNIKSLIAQKRCLVQYQKSRVQTIQLAYDGLKINIFDNRDTGIK